MKLRLAMKTRAVLTGIAALFLATGTVHAEEKLVDFWWTDCRHGWITKQFKPELMQDNPPVEITDTSVRITYDELRKLLKDLPRITRALKACDAYRKCLMTGRQGKLNIAMTMIVAGVNSLRELGNAAGIRVAYYDTQSGTLDHRQSHHGPS